MRPSPVITTSTFNSLQFCCYIIRKRKNININAIRQCSFFLSGKDFMIPHIRKAYDIFIIRHYINDFIFINPSTDGSTWRGVIMKSLFAQQFFQFCQLTIRGKLCYAINIHSLAYISLGWVSNIKFSHGSTYTYTTFSLNSPRPSATVSSLDTLRLCIIIQSYFKYSNFHFSYPAHTEYVGDNKKLIQ